MSHKDDDAVRVAYQQASDFLNQASLLLVADSESRSTNNVTTAQAATLGAALVTLPTTRLTRGMHEALQQWQTKVTCPLCHLVMVRPVSLTMCGHTFCESCIDDYVDNSWTCPSTLCAAA
jgi:Zinc finger, C3HC4 type (RING finger)